jgi:ADP-heptose:LPS heptosyltransferase
LYFPDGETEMKALIICGESIGDVVFSTPAIRALKVELDDIQASWIISRKMHHFL